MKYLQPNGDKILLKAYFRLKIVNVWSSDGIETVHLVLAFEFDGQLLSTELGKYNIKKCVILHAIYVDSIF